MIRSLLIVVVCLLCGFSSQAHQVRPAQVVVVKIENGVYQIRWPENAEIRLASSETCTGARPNQRHSVWTQIVRCSASDLDDHDLTFEIENTFILLRRMSDGSSEVLNPGTHVVALAQHQFHVLTYFQLGVHHIAFGWDHLLFVFCLVLIAGKANRILAVITGFTLAHSATLALATFKFVSVHQTATEVIIGLSIVWLARELCERDKDTWTWRFPMLVSILFGLLHGLGFSGALSEIGLPKSNQLAALALFNIGVEVGQLMFVALISLLWLIIRRWLTREMILQPSGYLAGSVAALWTLERMFF